MYVIKDSKLFKTSLQMDFYLTKYLVKILNIFNWCFLQWDLKGLEMNGINLTKCLIKAGKTVL